ncbi:DUF6261 family protein [Ancylomarina longa]|uniref:Uncharacterized protein n=1 Tax=Ancylomarina longa TaxID=2487017 RepID=A0A434AX47_9BACT|nr:DUF6261 family protein [Ancylomarina longa]RUT79006.1 hypothetical protein DLK05_05870 [Ancylomarina longa]
MIKNMLLSMLRVNELLAYSREIISRVKPLRVEGLQIMETIDTFDSKLQMALHVANGKRTNDYTHLLHESDHRRDESYLAFRNSMEAATHCKDQVKAQKAANICEIIRGHGWSLHVKGQKVQSSIMASLFKDLSQEERKLDIVDLGAESYYQDLIDDCAAYDSLLEKRDSESKGKKNPENEQVYKELRVSCEQFFEALEVLNRVAPQAQYVEMIEIVNQCTDKYMIDLRSRKTRSEHVVEEAGSEQEQVTSEQDES